MGQNGMLLPAAFLPRRGERYLSVNWLEYFDKADLGDAIEQVQEVFRRKGYNVKSNGRFAVLEVGAAKAVGDTLCIKHLPSINDESHAGIFGDTTSNTAAELAILASRALYPTS